MPVTRMYVPQIGQSDAAARAAALNAGLSVAETANAPRYRAVGGQLPAVVLENGEQIVVIHEPTTLAAVDQVAADLAALDPPAPEPLAPQPQVALTYQESIGTLTVNVVFPDGTTKTAMVPLI